MSETGKRVMRIETKMAAHRFALTIGEPLAIERIDIGPVPSVDDRPDEPLFPVMNRANRRALMSNRK